MRLENKQLVLDEINKTKHKEKTIITVQKLHFNGGDVGEYRRQIGSFVDDRDGYTRFVGIDRC
uniref:Uncharacterized protein n=1 Tax=Romanomermis culicivorax TaxID=13658 RepID=A0A915KX24_ROMCU